MGFRSSYFNNNIFSTIEDIKHLNDVYLKALIILNFSY